MLVQEKLYSLYNCFCLKKKVDLNECQLNRVYSIVSMLDLKYYFNFEIFMFYFSGVKYSVWICLHQGLRRKV